MNELKNLCNKVNLWSLQENNGIQYSILNQDQLDEEKEKINSYFKPRKSTNDSISGAWRVSRISPVGYYEVFNHLYDECIEFIYEKNRDHPNKVLTIYEFYKVLTLLHTQRIFLPLEDDDDTFEDDLKWLQNYIYNIKKVTIPEHLLSNTVKPVVTKVKKVTKPADVKPKVEKKSDIELEVNKLADNIIDESKKPVKTVTKKIVKPVKVKTKTKNES